jgi:hypothetical protein
VHLVGYNVIIYHDAQSSEWQILSVHVVGMQLNLFITSPMVWSTYHTLVMTIIMFLSYTLHFLLKACPETASLSSYVRQISRMSARHIKYIGLLHAQILGFLCHLKDDWELKTWCWQYSLQVRQFLFYCLPDRDKQLLWNLGNKASTNTVSYIRTLHSVLMTLWKPQVIDLP